MSDSEEIVVVKVEPEISGDPLEQGNGSVTEAEDNPLMVEEPLATPISPKSYNKHRFNEEIVAKNHWIYGANSAQEPDPEEDAVDMEEKWVSSTAVGWSLRLEQQSDLEAEANSDLERESDGADRNGKRRKREKTTHHMSFRFHGFLTHTTTDGNNKTVTNCELVDIKGDTYTVVGGYDSPSGFSIVLKKVNDRKEEKSRAQGTQFVGWVESAEEDWDEKTEVASSVDSDKEALHHPIRNKMAQKDEEQDGRIKHEKEIPEVKACNYLGSEHDGKSRQPKRMNIKRNVRSDTLPSTVGDAMEQAEVGKCLPNKQKEKLTRGKRADLPPTKHIFRKIRRKETFGNVGDPSGTTSKKGGSRTSLWSKRFQCHYCYRSFYYKESLKRHEHGKHAVGNHLECAVCGKRFFTKRGVTGHLIIKHQLIEKPYKCSACGNGFLQKRFYDKHMKLHSGVLYCQICKKHFKNFVGFNNHMIAHSGVLPYTCDICKKSFVDRFNMWRHFRSKHTGQRIECELCPKTFARKESKQAHVNHVHLKIKPNICDICKKGFVTRTALMTHMAIHEPDRSFLCETCGTVFSSQNRLSTHMSSYHNINLIAKPSIKLKQPSNNANDNSGCQCSVCGKVVTSKTNMKAHSLVHSNDRPFACSVCGKTFKLKFVLKQHMGTHAGAKFPCTMCSRSYTFESNLRRHFNVHTQANVYQCPTCAKKFSASQTLKNHMLAHAGIKRFSCHICDMKLSDGRSFKNHMRRHGVEANNFECPLCRSLFKSKNLLEKHSLSCKNNGQDVETESNEQKDFILLDIDEFKPCLDVPLSGQDITCSYYDTE